MLKSVFSYLRPIWEGDDNKPSIRRLFAIIFLIGIIRMIELSYSKSCDLSNDVLMTLCGTILLLLGIITVQNILKYRQNNVNS